MRRYTMGEVCDKLTTPNRKVAPVLVRFLIAEYNVGDELEQVGRRTVYPESAVDALRIALASHYEKMAVVRSKAGDTPAEPATNPARKTRATLAASA